MKPALEQPAQHLRRQPVGTPPLRRFAGLLMLAAAQSQAQAPNITDPALLKLQGRWRIEQARTEPMLDKRRAELDFSADGRLAGHTSCNALQARYTLDGDRLTLGPLALTKQRCAPLQMEQEDRVLSALEAVATARVRSDGLLELRDADGRGVLRATRLPAAP